MKTHLKSRQYKRQPFYGQPFSFGAFLCEMCKKKVRTKNKLCKLQRNTIDITENRVYNDYNNITKNIKKNIRKNSKMTKRERVIAAIEGKHVDAIPSSF